MSSMGSGGGGGSNFGSAGSDIFAGLGELVGGLAEMKGYQKAASFEKQNAQIEREAGAINQLREQRKGFEAIGATTAAYGGSGVRSNSGSALSIIAQEHRDINLDKSLIGLQTQINVNADLAKASEYSAEATAKGAGGIFGFLGSIVGAASFL